MLATMLQPVWLAVLLGWSFAVLSAAQLTIRLIMVFSVRLTLVGAVLLTLVALLAAAVFDLTTAGDPSLSNRLSHLPVAMLIMALGGFAIARWHLRIKRLRGQIIAGLMIGLLDPHLFTVLSS
jgi:hypothetical protein